MTILNNDVLGKLMLILCIRTVCVPGLALLLVCVVWDLGRACTLDGITMICQEVPSSKTVAVLIKILH